jgi:hypothetical protein
VNVQPGDGGNNGPPTPAPVQTPDTRAEGACNNAGGTFLDVIGQGGVSCAGAPGGTPRISGGTCGLTYSLGPKGTSTVTDGNVTYDGVTGLRIDANNCNDYQIFH